ncbi:hypothetical protein AB6A23_12395 [Paenibacillus tarimensis]
MKTKLSVVLLIAVIVVAIAGFYIYTIKAYYPPLPVEGLSKRDAVALLNEEEGGLVKLHEDHQYIWYGYKGNQLDASKALINEMKIKQWTYKDQMGAGYFFVDEAKEERIITSQMWTSKFVLFKVSL